MQCVAITSVHYHMCYHKLYSKFFLRLALFRAIFNLLPRIAVKFIKKIDIIIFRKLTVMRLTRCK